MDNGSLAGVLALVLYVIVKDLLVPILKKLFIKADKNDGKGMEHRVSVLEVNLTAVTAQIRSFEQLLEQQGEGIDNKMDILLSEMKDMRDQLSEAHRTLSERIAKAETHIEHLLQHITKQGLG